MQQQPITTKKLSQIISTRVDEGVFNQLTTKDVLDLFQKQEPSYSDFQYTGHGLNSLILMAIHNGKQVALKIIQCNKNLEFIQSVKKEYEYLQSLSQSSYFVAMNRCFYLLDEEEEESLQQKYFVLDMQMCDCSLSQLLQLFREEQKQLTDKQKEILVIQMLDALNMLHNKEIVHRDIKTDNILISYSHQFKDIPFVAKLSDLGLAPQLSAKKSKYFLSGKGTQNYMALEVEQGQQRKQSDLFALGIVLLELDNFLTFESAMINTLELSLLRRQGVDALKDHKLNRKSFIFSIAKILLNPDYHQRQSVEQIILKFLQSGKYSDIPAYSIITKESVSGLSHFSLPEPIQQKELPCRPNVSSSEQDHLINNQKSPQFMFKSKSQIQKIEEIDHIQISSSMIILAIKALYEKNKFTLFSYLGRGTSGVVFAVKNMIEKRESVIKICLGKDKIGIMREIAVMKICSSPYIVQFYGYELFKDEKGNEYVLFEFEKCTCSLSHYLSQNQEKIQKSPGIKLSIALQIMDSVNTLHRQNILHGDIKLDNFLIKEDESDKVIIKLTDFDQSGILHNAARNYDHEEQQQYKGVPHTQFNSLYLKGKEGTPVFRSPERYYNPQESTFSSDSFSVGLCLLLVDNFSQFDPVFVNHYFSLLQPYELPFRNCHYLFKTDTPIYQWAISLLKFHRPQRLLMREILDKITDSPIPLYSKRFYKLPLPQSQLEASCLFLKGIKLSDITQLFKTHATTFSSCLQSLQLDLGNNKIASESVILLSQSISKLNSLSSLALSLENIQISIEGVISLSSSISNLTSLSSLALSLENNQVTSEGAISLSSSLSKLNSLLSLTLSLGFNQITNEGVISLSSSLSKLNSLLSLTFYLSSNQITNEGVISLSLSLSKLSSLSSLTLSLDNNQIKNEDVTSLSSSLSKLNSLSNLILYLRFNQIKSEGINSLSSSLSKLNSLSSLTLYLFDNQFRSEGIISLSISLSNLNSLLSLTLDLSSNQITSGGLISLSSSLSKLSSLSSLILYLGNNQIISQGVISLSSSLSKLNSLSSLTLNLSNNQITSEDVISLSSSLSKLNLLSSLTLYLYGNDKITSSKKKDELSDLMNQSTAHVLNKSIRF